MPDRGNSDSDLNGLFERFVDEVGARSRALGAEPAIRSARRRRWRRSAAVSFVVVAVLAGIVGGAAEIPGHHLLSPVGRPNTTATPSGRTLDRSALEQATQGWVSNWRSGTPSVSTALPCAASVDPARPHPLRRSTREFQAGPRIGATLTIESYADVDQAHDSPAWLVDPKCEALTWSMADEIWDGGDSVGLRLNSAEQTFHHLVVVHRTEVATLTVAGASLMPEAVRQRIVQAMLAELRR